MCISSVRQKCKPHFIKPFGCLGDASIVKVPRRFDTVVMKEGQKELLLNGKKLATSLEISI